TAGYSNPFSWLSPISLGAPPASAWPARNDNPRYACKIGSDLFHRKASIADHFSDCIGPPRAELGDDEPAWLQQPRQVRHGRAIGIGPAGAAIERAIGIVIAPLGRQTRQLCRRDVRRVRDDDIESAGQGLAPVGDDKLRALAEAEPFCVMPRRHRRTRRDIDP